MRTNALANEKRDDYSNAFQAVHTFCPRLRIFSNKCFSHFYCVCYDNPTFVCRRRAIANIRSYI